MLGSHTGTSIKNQYNKILEEYKIETVYKVVADQAANMKKAFADEPEGILKNNEQEDFFLIFAQNLLVYQRREELEALKKKQEEQARVELEKDIEEMNKSSPNKVVDLKNYTREQVKI